MPTTTVKKGANRGSAMAKRNRHAQRTPLPNPKSREDAAGVIAILAAEKAQAGSRPKPKADKPAAAKSGPNSNGSKPNADPEKRKAVAFHNFATEQGWATTVEQTSKNAEMVVAEKDGEAITIWFVDNKLDGANMPVYASGDRRIQIKNVSAAKKQILGTPDRPVQELKRTARRSTRSVKAGASVAKLFDPATSSDKEILDALRGRSITWHSKLSGGAESARVPRDGNPKFYRLDRHPARPALEERVLHFVSPDGGFRSVSLARIVRVR